MERPEVTIRLPVDDQTDEGAAGEEEGEKEEGEKEEGDEEEEEEEEGEEKKKAAAQEQQVYIKTRTNCKINRFVDR